MNEIIRNGEGSSYQVDGYEEIDEEVKAEVNNTKLMYKPEFIPFYLKEVKENGLSNTEGLVYGFIRFYLASNPKGQFYFTNEQLAYMLDVSPQTISNSIATILEKKLFKATYKQKANGGTFRLIENYKSEADYKGFNSLTTKNFIGNNNKINKNIYISKDIGKPVSLKKKDKEKKERIYGNKDINECITYLREKVGGQLDGTERENRRYCYNLLRKIKKIYPEANTVEQVKKLIDIALEDKFHKRNATSFKYLFYNFVKISKSYENERYSRNAREFEREMEEVKKREKVEYSHLRVEGENGNLVKLSDMLKKYRGNSS